MAPKLKRRDPRATFRPSASTLSSFQMPTEDGDQLAQQLSDGEKLTHIDATYSAECRAFAAPSTVPPPAAPGRKEERPSSGRFWARFAEAAAAKAKPVRVSGDARSHWRPQVPLPKKRAWAPALPPPPQRHVPAPSLSDVGRQAFDEQTRLTGSCGQVPGSPWNGDRLAYSDCARNERPFQRTLRVSHGDAARTAPRFSWDKRDSSLNTLNSDASSIVAARHSMNLGNLSPRDSTTWPAFATGDTLATDSLAFPADFRWDSGLGVLPPDGDGMDLSG